MRALSYIIIYLFAVACSKASLCDDGLSLPEVRFGVISNKETRVVDNMWDGDDRIGISMKRTDSSIPISCNIEYKTANTTPSLTVNFLAVDGNRAILFPNGTAVDFYAYYPYCDSLHGSIYGVDISNQSKDVDFIWAEITNKSTTQESQMFQFEHKLSKVQFIVSGGDCIDYITSAQATLTGVTTYIDYDLRTGCQIESSGKGVDNEIALNTRVEDGVAIISAMVIPEDVKDAILSLNVNSRTFKLALNARFKAGVSYSYNVELSGDDDLPQEESGDGSLENPFKVSSKDDMAKIGSGIDGWNHDCHYALAANIDFENELWLPIESFSGTFDGHGFWLANLYIAGGENQALFSVVEEGGEVKNLNVQGSISSKGYLAAIVAENSGIISNCFFEGTIKVGETSSRAGAIVGYNRGLVQECQNIGIVETEASKCRIGGIVGVNMGGVVINCSNRGVVLGSEGSIAGGVAGYGDGSSKIINSCNIAKVYCEGSSSIGGVAGQMFGGEIYNCFNSGVLQSGSNSYIGGVVGYANSMFYSCIIENIYYEDSAEKGLGRYSSGSSDTTISVKKSEMQTIWFVNQLNTNVADYNSQLPQGDIKALEWSCVEYDFPEIIKINP